MIRTGRRLCRATLTAILAAVILVATVGPSRAYICREAGREIHQVLCLLSEAKTDGQPIHCARSVDLSVRAKCFSVYAERHRDPAVCQLLIGRDRETQALRDACVSRVAVVRREVELCGELRLPVGRDVCFVTLVLQQEADPAHCEQVAEPLLRTACRDGGG